MTKPTTTPRHRDGYSLIRDIALTLAHITSKEAH